MKFAFIDTKKALYPVAVLCRHLGLSRSSDYAWAARPECERKKRDRALHLEVAAVYQDSRGTYGAPRVHAELKARGQRVARKRVARLMRRQAGLRGRARRRFVRTTDSAHHHPVGPNTLERNFQLGQFHRTWVGDITSVWTDEG